MDKHILYKKSFNFFLKIINIKIIIIYIYYLFKNKRIVNFIRCKKHVIHKAATILLKK
jgi:hypothetical protein